MNQTAAFLLHTTIAAAAARTETAIARGITESPVWGEVLLPSPVVPPVLGLSPVLGVSPVLGLSPVPPVLGLSPVSPVLGVSPP